MKHDNKSNEQDIEKKNTEVIDVSLEEFIEYINKPIVIKNNALGTLKLRHIFEDDLNYLLKSINKNIESESLCKGFIINQLNSPEISIESLNSLNKSEIRSILEKYLKHNNMEEYFNLTDDNIYDDFKEGVISYKKDIVKPFEANYDKIITSLQNSLNSLNIYSSLGDYILNSQINSMQTMAKNLGVSQAVENIKYMADIASPTNTLNTSNISQAMDNADSARRAVSSIIDSNKDTISQAMTAANSVRNMMDNIEMPNMTPISQALSVTEPISKTMINLLSIFDNSTIVQVSEILKAIKPQIDIWNNWIINNNHVLKFYEESNAFWKKLEKHYNISKKRALNCVKKYHWFISPSMDPSIVYNIVSICEGNSKSKWGEINHVFNDYFLDNNCENLFLFIDNWTPNPIFKGRLKIIKDCVEIISNPPNNVNFSNIVVPVLIPQIEGVQNEFMYQNGLKVNKNIVCDLDGNRKKDKHGQNIKFNRYIRELTSGDEFLDAMNDVFLEVLFQHTMPGEDYQTSIKFSRHKILHGENFRYGRKDYTMRCFMILDFLHGLSLEN